MRPHNFVLLRTPINSLLKAGKAPEIDSLFDEALYIASENFWNELHKKGGEKDDKINISIQKYWLRSCTRCTPFGLFAGNSIIYLSKSSNILLDTHKGPLRKVRLDMELISAIVAQFQKDPALREGQMYYLNNSLYKTPFDYRFAEYRFQGSNKEYSITSIEPSDYLDVVLKAAATGVKLGTLVELLTSFLDVTIDEASVYVDELCEAQILVSELDICVTGEEPLQQLKQKLTAYPGIETQKDTLSEISRLLSNDINKISDYERIKTELDKLGFQGLNLKRAFQVDSTHQLLSNEISAKVVQRTVDQINDLFCMSDLYRHPLLEQFKKAYKKKFENSEIPLSIALDADVGIGYGHITELTTGGSDWINDLKTESKATPQYRQDLIQDFVQEKYHDYLKCNLRQIEINKDDLKRFEHTKLNNSFLNSMYILGSFQKINEEFDVDNFQFDFELLSGASGGNLLSRFTHGDAVLTELVKQVIEEEENLYPEVIFAEIVHLPNSNIGNVSIRPFLRKFELPYVGLSGADESSQILVSDLLISVQNDEIVIRSKKHNKRVIPRLTTAHNYSYNSLPLYQFLCDLQHQGIAYPRFWDWSKITEIKFFPRVVYKNIIVKKARWLLTTDDLCNLPVAVDDYCGYFSSIFLKSDIPEKVLVKDGDNRLLINLYDNLSLQILVKEIKRRGQIEVIEFLFNHQNSIVFDEQGNPYTNEVIIPIINNERLATYDQRLNSINIERKFHPGSEWLYYKIFAGVKSLEHVLLKYYLPFLEELSENNGYQKFFFVRYVDERPHLRMRFFNENIDVQNVLQAKFAAFNKILLDKKHIDNVQIDTYIQESNRYGLENIDAVESMFYNDSLTTISFLALLEDSNSEFYRIIFAMRSIFNYLDSFNYDKGEKYLFIKKMAESFFSEYGGSAILKKQLNNKYKYNSARIFTFMDHSADEKNGFDDAGNLLKKRAQLNLVYIEELLLKNSKATGNVNFDTLVSDIIHMSINRIFLFHGRRYELVVYFFLERFYSSSLARGNS